MYFNSRSVLLCIFCLWLALPASALDMKGAAVYQELGIEYYVASLYLADGSFDSYDIVSYPGLQSIKIKVTHKRWSRRKWKAQWQNNIAINNQTTNDRQLFEAIAYFTEFPRGSLKAGDEVVITYDPAQGSYVTFNGYPILATENKEFYNCILNTWLGKFSPNRVFREQVAGIKATPASLVGIIGAEVHADRIVRVGTWFVLDRENERRAQKEKQRIKAEQLAVLKQQKDKEILAQRKADEKNRQLWLAKQAAIKKIELEKKQQLATIKKEEQRLALEKAEQERLKTIGQQKYLHQLYQWQVRTRVNETVAYPDWAREHGQQGVVDIDFKVSRFGVLLELEYLGKDTPPIFQQEVERRLQLAIKDIALPKNLTGDAWAFNASYVFDLNLTEQELLLKPLKPM